MSLTRAAYYIAVATWACIQAPNLSPRPAPRGPHCRSKNTFDGRPVSLARTGPGSGLGRLSASAHRPPQRPGLRAQSLLFCAAWGSMFRRHVAIGTAASGHLGKVNSGGLALPLEGPLLWAGGMLDTEGTGLARREAALARAAHALLDRRWGAPRSASSRSRHQRRQRKGAGGGGARIYEGTRRSGTGHWVRHWSGRGLSDQ